mmetsp:Transcript_19768/g.29757  ORF Transcript_19768/g.29757 Transcript_19768/m.29757 type:complete len:288 (-) Transcript_19768:226-1089(-)
MSNIKRIREYFRGGKVLRVQKVQNGIQFHQIILQRRSSQDDTGLTMDFTNRLGNLRCQVFNDMSFVQYAQVEVGVANETDDLRILGHFVRGDNDIVGHDVMHHCVFLLLTFIRVRCMKSETFEGGSMFLHFRTPTVQHTQGANNKGGPIKIGNVFFQMCNDRNRLQRLPQPHLISKYPRHALLMHLDHPVQSNHLIITESSLYGIGLSSEHGTIFRFRSSHLLIALQSSFDLIINKWLQCCKMTSHVIESFGIIRGNSLFDDIVVFPPLLDVVGDLTWSTWFLVIVG